MRRPLSPNVLSIMAKGYRLRFRSPWERPHGKSDLPRGPEHPRNARANIPDALKVRDHRDTSGYSRILFESFPGTQSIRRVASYNGFKTTERPHLRTSLSHANYKLGARKRRLCVQNNSAGCVLSCTYASRQQEVPTFFLRKQGRSIPVLSSSLRSEHCPSGIYFLGYTGAAYLHCRGI